MVGGAHAEWAMPWREQSASTQWYTHPTRTHMCTHAQAHPSHLKAIERAPNACLRPSPRPPHLSIKAIDLVHVLGLVVSACQVHATWV